MIIRTRKNRNYTCINNTVLEDERLSWRARGIAAFLLSKPDDWEINHTYLWKHGKEGRDAILVAMKELEDCGYLIRQKKQTQDGKFLTEVTLIEEPNPAFQDSVEKPTPENQKSVYQKSVFQDSLVSTELVSTEEQLLLQQKAKPSSSGGAKPLDAERGAVHKCWQQNMPGMMVQILAEEIDELIDEYGAAAMIHGITVAVNANVRTMRYIKGVLRREGTAAMATNKTNGKDMEVQKVQGEEW